MTEGLVVVAYVIIGLWFDGVMRGLTKQEGDLCFADLIVTITWPLFIIMGVAAVVFAILRKCGKNVGTKLEKTFDDKWPDL